MLFFFVFHHFFMSLSKSIHKMNIYLEHSEPKTIFLLTLFANVYILGSNIIYKYIVKLSNVASSWKVFFCLCYMYYKTSKWDRVRWIVCSVLLMTMKHVFFFSSFFYLSYFLYRSRIVCCDFWWPFSFFFLFSAYPLLFIVHFIIWK